MMDKEGALVRLKRIGEAVLDFVLAMAIAAILFLVILGIFSMVSMLCDWVV